MGFQVHYDLPIGVVCALLVCQDEVQRLIDIFVYFFEGWRVGCVLPPGDHGKFHSSCYVLEVVEVDVDTAPFKEFLKGLPDDVRDYPVPDQELGVADHFDDLVGLSFAEQLP